MSIRADLLALIDEEDEKEAEIEMPFEVYIQATQTGAKQVFLGGVAHIAAAEYLKDSFQQKGDQREPLRIVTIYRHRRTETKQVSSKAAHRIVLAPGVRLSAVARAVLTPRAYRRYVMVSVSEMQAEYIEEIHAGNRRKAHWVSIRGHVLIFWALLRALLPARLRNFLTG